VFENTECQWPLFYCYEIINGCFEKDDEAVEKYSDMLDDVSTLFTYLKSKVLI
jgi:phosphorylase kinase alpha/beta subunit